MPDDDAVDYWNNPVFRAGYRAGYKDGAGSHGAAESELQRIERDMGRLGHYGPIAGDESYVDEYYGKNDI
jgi:hypothetical protein